MQQQTLLIGGYVFVTGVPAKFSVPTAFGFLVYPGEAIVQLPIFSVNDTCEQALE